MSRQIQIRRGTSTEHENFTGAVGEITMDTTNKTLRVHDGTTAGGTILAKQSEITTLQTNITNILQNPTFLIPDYAHGTEMAANTTHTATENGWVFFYQFNNANRWFYIDGHQFRLGAGNAGDNYSGNCIMIPILKNQTFMGNGEIMFFPCINA